MRSGRRAQQLELIGVAQQREQAVADEVHRRLVAGDEQQDDRRQQLVGAEAVARLLGRDQRADEVGPGRPPALLEERHEVGGEGQAPRRRRDRTARA